MLLGGGVEVIVRRPFDIPGLGLLYRPGRVLPDFPFYKPGAMPQYGLANKFGAVGPLGAHIFLLHLENFSMYKTMNRAAGHPACTLYRAGLFRRLLSCQLFLCLFYLSALLFHAELGCRRLFLLAFLPEFGLGRLRDTLSRSSRLTGPRLLFRASPKSRTARIGGPAPGVSAACLRPRLRAWFIRFSFHCSYPPGGW